MYWCVSSKLHEVIPEDADFCSCSISPEPELGVWARGQCVTHIVRLSRQRYVILTGSCGYLSRRGILKTINGNVGTFLPSGSRMWGYGPDRAGSG
jgi:hypothetical protein